MKAVARAMKEEEVRKINELGRNPNNVFRLVRKMKIESTDVVGGRCMQENDGNFYLNEKDRAKLWKAHMSKITNEENERDQIADADTVEGPIERVMIKEIVEVFKYLKIGMAPGPTEVYAEIILASGDVGIRALVKLCHGILDGKGMPEEWATSVAFPIFKVNGDIVNCGMYRGVKLLLNRYMRKD